MSQASGYGRELARLSDTWAAVHEYDCRKLTAALEGLLGVPTAYVASGGALAVARFAADLHVNRFESLARATTPLELLGFGPSRRMACVLFSARARHSDVTLAAEQAASLMADPLILVTQVPSSDVDPDIRRRARVITLPKLAPDGFLATNSVLLMTGIWARVHEHLAGEALPASLPSLHESAVSRVPRSRIVVLYGPTSASAAVDLEARLSETGVAQVQLADFRNFAHGRHSGFATNLERTSVVALTQPESSSLSQATKSEFPPETDWFDLSTPLSGPAGTIDLLVASMKFAGAIGWNRSIDVSSPSVPDYGRRLYRLDSTDFAPSFRRSPLDLKLLSAGLVHLSDPSVRRDFANSYGKWKEELHAANLGGLVIDHDGTCTTTRDRDGLPPRPVRNHILRLLDSGCPIAVATGRGWSIRSLLRKWVPQEYWNNVHLGAYSGSTWVRLMDERGEKGEMHPDIVAAGERIREHPLSRMATVDIRSDQITITPRLPAIAPNAVAITVLDLVRRKPALPVAVNVSGHSVDILSPRADKALVVQALTDHTGKPALAIGDQGQYPGNDHSLLASTVYSLTVDTASADPTRCWHFEQCDIRGPGLLETYLARLRYSKRTLKFTPEA